MQALISQGLTARTWTAPGANALGHMSLLDRWNPDVMLGRIGKTRWFL
jgi:hypothetical protein